MYDARKGRWDSPDPLADPDGMWDDWVIKKITDEFGNITDEKTGRSDVLTLDLRCPVDVQLSVGVFGKVIMLPLGALEDGTSHLLFIASAEHDYGAKTLFGIAKAVGAVFGSNLVWELSPDRPPEEPDSDIKAYLTLNTKRYEKYHER